MEDKLELGLLENGMDFVVSALDHLQREERTSDLKYAVLHLSSGTELILKHRLVQEHWTLIYKDVSKANLQNFITGDFVSVDQDECVARVQNICQIELSKIAKDELRVLKAKRNKFIHFTSKESTAALKSSFYNVLNVLVDFILRNIDRDKFNESEKELFGSIWERVQELKEFVEERMNLIKEELENAATDSFITNCNHCSQDAMVVAYGSNQYAKCLFCEHQEDGRVIAQHYIEEILHISQYECVTQGGEYPLYICEECGHESLVGDEDKWACYSCGCQWDIGDITYCDTCGSVYMVGEHDLGMCDNCIDHRMNRD
ncbi:hypothetical protein [Paenibacillus woosongensis]|uniref:HsdR n=1 Tax=Paenibacillus woosongensis TaxID=307580 RepID=A0ABQ4MT33_9BACL|nr:hypothetical protein [Paenibacillus woosongensis]GIP59086.1 hypothetical protein J15TS10_29000 [Paenibacillus woosongensis]